MAGARARRELESRQLKPETIAQFGYGFAPAAGRETLAALFATVVGVPVGWVLACPRGRGLSRPGGGSRRVATRGSGSGPIPSRTARHVGRREL